MSRVIYKHYHLISEGYQVRNRLIVTTGLIALTALFSFGVIAHNDYVQKQADARLKVVQVQAEAAATKSAALRRQMEADAQAKALKQRNATGLTKSTFK